MNVLFDIDGNAGYTTAVYLIPKVTAKETKILSLLNNVHMEDLDNGKSELNQAYYYVSAAVGQYDKEILQEESDRIMDLDACISALNKWKTYKVDLATLNRIIKEKKVVGVYSINHCVM